MQHWIKALATAGVTLGLVLGGALVPTVAAQAADGDGIPPTALPGCADPGDTGGWLLRQFTTRSTRSTGFENVPVRPRTITLGEPCYSDDTLKIPIEVSEVPQPGYDPDDPDGLPSAGTDSDCSKHANETNTWDDDYGYLNPMECDELAISLLASTPYVLDPTADVNIAAAVPGGSPRNLVITKTGTIPVGSDQRGGVIRVMCKNDVGTGWSTQQVVSMSWTTTAPTFPATVTCPTGSHPNHALSLHRVGSSSTRMWGTFWRADNDGIPGTPANTLGYQSSFAQLGSNINVTPPQPSYFVCSNTRQGPTSNVTISKRVESTEPPFAEGGYIDADTIFLPKTESGIQWSDVTMPSFSGLDFKTTCPYLREIKFSVCIWVDYGAMACTQTTWAHSIWERHPEYNDPTPEEDACAGEVFNDILCAPILYPPYVDPATWDACSDQPAWGEKDYGTGNVVSDGLLFMGDTALYYVECLFVPKGGWDNQGAISTAWDESIAGDIVAMVGQFGTAFSVAGSCGVIWDASTVLGGVVVDTCSWGWAAGTRLMLGLGIIIGFGVWAIRFYLRSVTGLVNRKVEAPFEDGSEW